jgi:hypothetical protein
MIPERSKSTPITLHRSASQTPVWLINHKKFLSDHPQLIDCPRCKVCLSLFFANLFANKKAAKEKNDIFPFNKFFLQQTIDHKYNFSITEKRRSGT